jgi:pimeloyl-ACP methyl ester carboxylesterase
LNPGVLSDSVTACYARNDDLLRRVSTADTARVLDLLRSALGQPKLIFIGLSYGTFLGATYANLFPNRVGHDSGFGIDSVTC